MDEVRPSPSRNDVRSVERKRYGPSAAVRKVTYDTFSSCSVPITLPSASTHAKAMGVIAFFGVRSDRDQDQEAGHGAPHAAPSAQCLQRLSPWPGKDPAWRFELDRYDRYLVLSANMLEVPGSRL